MKQIQEDLRSELNKFTGTEQYFKHWSGMLAYTDGVQFMAEKCGAYWLIDEIAFGQRACREDRDLRQIQFWTLKRNKDGETWSLTVARDKDDDVFRKKIPFSDFPLESIDLWVAFDGQLNLPVLMLPSEY